MLDRLQFPEWALPTSELSKKIAVLAIVLPFVLEFISYVTCEWRRKTRLVDLPVLNLENGNYKAAEQSYITDMKKRLQIGREKFREQGYQLWTPEGYLIILPDDHVEDLKNVHDSFADNTALAKGVIGDKLWVDLIRPEIPHTIRNNLTPKLGVVMPDMCDEMAHVLSTEMPQCQDWTRFKVYPKVLRMVSLISGRVFVGPELNRDQTWVQANIDYTIDLFRGGEQVKKLPYYIRDFAIKYGFLSQVNNIRRFERYAMKHLVPILQTRLKQQAEDPKGKKPRDMMQWIMENAQQMSPPLSLEQQAKTQLVLGMSAIHASSIATVNVIYDLVSRPEYIERLREEVDKVWEEHHGILEKRAMAKLDKLDSFLKESQRLNPAAHVTFDRQIVNEKGFTLSNGLHLPNGSHYAVAASMIATDPQNWGNPDEFDGLRFAKLRSEEGQPHKYQFVTTNSAHSMAFSHGKHACPGRFFAANEIKLITASLLRNYDFQAPKEWHGRPASKIFGHNWSPDPELYILIRERQL